MDNMLRSALRKYNGLRSQLDKNLLGDEGDVWEAEFKKFLRKEICWGKGEVTEVVTPKPTPTLLEPTPIVSSVPATTAPFIVKEQFPDAKFWWSPNFTSWFGGKTEAPRPASELKVDRLTKASLDGPIIAALGGEERAETTLSEMETFLQSADRNRWYLFYIKDVNGLQRTVDARWYGGGWGVGADAVECPGGWGAGGRVVSRKSVAV